MIGWLRGNAAMRALAPVGLVLAAALLLPTPAAAENRTFIIANYADGYGVDRCLATGEQCGDVVATSYCQSQSFAKAQSFRKVDRDEITGGPDQRQERVRGRQLRLIRRDHLLAVT